MLKPGTEHEMRQECKGNGEKVPHSYHCSRVVKQAAKPR